MKSLVLGCVLGATQLLLNGCGGSDGDEVANKTIAELAGANKNLSTLATALNVTGLVPVFNGTDKYTVFAPTNDAFKNLDPEVLACLLDPVGLPKLKEVLKYHAVQGSSPAKDLSNGKKLETLYNNEDLTVKIEGKTVMINKANVTLADVYATNGLVHVIDKVLIPPNYRLPICGSKTVTDLAVSTKDLSTLVAALTATNIAGLFDGKDVYTVFAPTNKAFAQLKPPTLNYLLDPVGLPKLKQLLEYHVVPAYALAADLKDDEKLMTLFEKNHLTVTRDGKQVKINDATVTMADQYATNGVIHEINAVLIPDKFTLPECTKTPRSIVV